MSSDWQPHRTPLFAVALIPPRPLAVREAAPVTPGGTAPDRAHAGPLAPAVACPVPAPGKPAPGPSASREAEDGRNPSGSSPARDRPASRTDEAAPCPPPFASGVTVSGLPGARSSSISISRSAGWTAAAVSAGAPVCIAVAAPDDHDLWAARWLHPAERRRIAAPPPAARRHFLRLLTAARRALVQALSLPAPAAASIDLSPLLEGAQSVRVGDWTVQRVPAPPGCFVAVAAPGSGWGYSLLPPGACPAPADA